MFPKSFYYTQPPFADFFSLSKFMHPAHSLKMINFRKDATCPASQNLLDFQKNDFSNEENETIRKHLTVCEFCAAEVEFYSRFPQSEVVCTETKIPAPLYQLAEALLSNKQKKFSLLKKLISENEGLRLEKA
jgi:hypothetical protein